MGFIDKTLKRTRMKATEAEAAASEENTLECEENAVDWEERHFQICLAMLSNPSIAKIASAHTERSIIARADAMVECLKEHYKENPQN